MTVAGGGGIVKTFLLSDSTTSSAIGAVEGTVGWTIRKHDIVVATADAALTGSGLINVSNSQGQVVASLQSVSNRGQVSVFNPQGVAIAYLTESDKIPGAGNVTVTNTTGKGVFSAGFDGTEGAACANLKTGMWCLGKNLPLTIK